MASKKPVKKAKAAAPKKQAKPAPAKAKAKVTKSAKKPTPKRASVAKPAPKAAKLKATKPVAAKKPAPAPAPKAVPAPKAAAKPAAKPVAPVSAPAKKELKPAAAKKGAKSKKAAVPEEEPLVVYKTNMNAKELAFHKDLLLKLRDRVIDEMNFLARDNIHRSGKDGAGDLSSYSFHMADQGTDNFDREFAANLLSGEQDVLYEIEEALRRIEGGSYGICEMSGQPIERERLKVIPYCRYSVAIQSQMEKGKPRFRPFKRTSIQQGVSGET